MPYLTPGRRTGEQGRIGRLAAGGVDVFREPHGSFGNQTREVLYERAESDDVETTISADETEQTRQSELWDELEATLDVDVRDSDRDERDVWSGFGDILDEDDQEDSDDEQATYYLWKTNVSLPEDDEAALNRVKRLYAKRWRIESAYQSLKQFLIPTTSKSQELRFWYFGFASLLYSVWRLVNVILRERVGGDDERPVVPAEMVVSFVRRATGTG